MHINWLDCFPQLKNLEDKAWKEAISHARQIMVKKGSVLFRDGGTCNDFVFVLSGAIRVQKMDPNGREIILYRVEVGQSCILTTTCMMGHKTYPAEGIAESDVELVLMSLTSFKQTLSSSDGFREYIMANIGERICDLMLLLEDVAFGRMDARLAKFLITREVSEDSIALRYTHQKIATELGTAREVVSRLLKDFERKGLVQLGRNKINVLQPSALKVMSDSPL